MTAYQPGGLRDRQQRVAQISQDIGQLDGILPLIQNAGLVPNDQADWPNPSFDRQRAGRFIAIRSNTPGEFGGILPQLANAGLKPRLNSDQPNPSFERLRTGRFIAQRSNTTGEFGGVLPQLLGKDNLPPGQTTYDTRRPYFFLRRPSQHGLFDFGSNGIIPELLAPPPLPVGEAALDVPSFTAPRTARFIAQRSNTSGESNSLLPQLLGSGPSAVVGSSHIAMPPAYLGRAKPREAPGYADPTEYWLLAPVADLPPGQATLDTRRPVAFLRRPQPLGLLDIGNNGILPESAGAPIGQSTFDSRLPPSPRLSAAALRDHIDPSELWLFGTDSMAAGQQSTELPPRAAPRLRDYSHSASLIPVLIGQDALAAGGQEASPPPRPAARLRDYTWLQALPLPLLVPVGTQQTELPPRAAARSRDYSYLDPTEYWLLQDAVNPGQQSTDLPRPAQRARDYTWLQSLSLPLFAPVGSAWQELPPRAAQRARDYSHSQPVALNLQGQDAMLAGQQISGNAPSAPRRANPQLDQPNILLTLLTAFVPPIPQGQQITDSLNPRAPTRARDYTHSAPTPLNLIGQDRVYGAPGETPAYDWSYQRPKSRYLQGTGEPIQDLLSTLLGAAPMPPGGQVFDGPTLGPRRARDYTWFQTLPLHIYQQLPPGNGIAARDLPPSAAKRSRDYTWLQGLPLHSVGQIPPGDTTAGSELPPAGPRRARDYSFAFSYLLTLIGKDQRLIGQQLTGPAPQGAARARDYTFLASVLLPLVAAASIQPGHHTVSDSALFEHLVSDAALFDHLASDSALFGHAASDAALYGHAVSDSLLITHTSTAQESLG